MYVSIYLHFWFQDIISDLIARIKKTHQELERSAFQVFLHGRAARYQMVSWLFFLNLFWWQKVRFKKQPSVQQKNDFTISFFATQLSKELMKQCRKTVFEGKKWAGPTSRETTSSCSPCGGPIYTINTYPGQVVGGMYGAFQYIHIYIYIYANWIWQNIFSPSIPWGVNIFLHITMLPGLRECQKCLLLQNASSRPVKTLQNDTQKPFFKKHKSPHFVREMGRGISKPLLFSRHLHW